MKNFTFDKTVEFVKLAYLAGIVDGEGSIGIEHLSPCKNRKKDYYTCRLTVINTDKKIMDLLKHFFKGSYDQRKVITGRRICYRWHVFGRDLEIAIEKLMPYLFIKKRQAETVLKYRKTVGKTGWNVSDEILETRKQLWLECKKLNNP